MDRKRIIEYGIEPKSFINELENMKRSRAFQVLLHDVSKERELSINKGMRPWQGDGICAVHADGERQGVLKTLRWIDEWVSDTKQELEAILKEKAEAKNG